MRNTLITFEPANKTTDNTMLIYIVNNVGFITFEGDMNTLVPTPIDSTKLQSLKKRRIRRGDKIHNSPITENDKACLLNKLAVWKESMQTLSMVKSSEQSYYTNLLNECKTYFPMIEKLKVTI